MSFDNILANEVPRLLQEETPVVFDMRDARSYEQGHIDGAQQVSDALIGQLIRRREQHRPVLIYCYHGISSQDFAKFLAQFGFSRIYNLEGGWQAWQSYCDSSN